MTNAHENPADYVSLHDASFLTRPTGGLPFNVGGLILIGPRSTAPMTRREFVALAERRLHLLPRFRKKLHWPTARGMRPYWIDDEQFDLDAHIIEEAPVGVDDGRALADLVADVFSDDLDPARPLWRFHWIPDRSERSAALILRASHALFDGMSGIEIARVLMDRREEPSHELPPPWTAKGALLEEDALAEQWAVREIAKIRSSWLRTAERIEGVPAHERRIEFLDGVISMLSRPGHGMPRLPGRRPQRLRFGYALSDQAQLRATARKLQVGLDELLAAAAASGLGRLLRARGQVGAAEKIRTMVPVAVPRRSRRETLGNAASYIIVALPIGDISAPERLRITLEELREARDAGQERTTARAIEIMEHLPLDVPLMAAAAASETPVVDVVVSFVRGPRRQLYIGGYPHLATVPVLPIAPSMRLSIGFIGLGAHVGIGVSAEAHAVPETDFLVDSILRGIDELHAVANGR